MAFLLLTSTDLWVPFSHAHYVNSYVPIFMYKNNEYAEAMYFYSPEKHYVCKSTNGQCLSK